MQLYILITKWWCLIVTTDLESLYRNLGYQFNNQRLIDAALTHRSLRGDNNERLEFLGDSIVNFLIAQTLYKKFPNAKEGKLSRLRASLVSGEALASVAREIDLGNFIRLGPGEQKSGGHTRDSILADAMEAIIAAIYIDSDMQQVDKLVLTWFQDRLSTASLEKHRKDAKTRLQELLQAKKLPLPTYEIINTEGDAHNQIFHIQCSVQGLENKTVGKGSNRRKAEQEAAEQFLEQLLH